MYLHPLPPELKNRKIQEHVQHVGRRRGQDARWKRFIATANQVRGGGAERKRKTEEIRHSYHCQRGPEEAEEVRREGKLCLPSQPHGKKEAQNPNLQHLVHPPLTKEAKRQRQRHPIITGPQAKKETRGRPSPQRQGTPFLTIENHATLVIDDFNDLIYPRLI